MLPHTRTSFGESHSTTITGTSLVRPLGMICPLAPCLTRLPCRQASLMVSYIPLNEPFSRFTAYKECSIITCSNSCGLRRFLKRTLWIRDMYREPNKAENPKILPRLFCCHLVAGGRVPKPQLCAFAKPCKETRQERDQCPQTGEHLAPLGELFGRLTLDAHGSRHDGKQSQLARRHLDDGAVLHISPPFLRRPIRHRETGTLTFRQCLADKELLRQ